MGELLLLLSLLAVRRVRREYPRTMSKNADKEHELEEWSTLHPCFIAIFVVLYCCLLFEKMCSLYHRTFLSVKRRFLYPLGLLLEQPRATPLDMRVRLPHFNREHNLPI
jgi:hypothetical protein